MYFPLLYMCVYVSAWLSEIKQLLDVCDLSVLCLNVNELKLTAELKDQHLEKRLSKHKNMFTWDLFINL